MANEFNGRPVNGEISHYTSGPQKQDDPQLFLDALDAVLATSGVEAVRWNQYTPYFNDGEACEFSIYGAEVKITGDTADQEDGEDDWYETESGQGWRTTYDLYDYGSGGYNDRKYVTIGEFDGQVIFEALNAFENVLENGRHFAILNEKFGDPAQVTATTAGFSVEFYEHD